MKTIFHFVERLSATQTFISYLTEYVWYNFFIFLSNLNCQEQSVTMQQTEKKKNAFPWRELPSSH